MFGRDFRMPYEATHHPVASNGEEVSSYGEFVEEIRSNLYEAHEICRRHLKHAAQRQKDIYNAKMLIHRYTIGDFVWLLNEIHGENECPKFKQAYVGHCIVTETFSDLVFKIQVDARGDSRVVNHNKLLPYQGDCPPKWIQKVVL